MKEREVENLAHFQKSISDVKIDSKNEKEFSVNNKVVIPAENYFRPAARR